MTHKTGRFLLLVGVMGGLFSFQTSAQQEDAPVGWPYRPQTRDLPVPMPAQPEPKKTGDPKAAESPRKSGYPKKIPEREKPVPYKILPQAPSEGASQAESYSASDPDSPAMNAIAPLERFLLPVPELDFTYDAGRIALTRDEVNQLSRLAQRLRAGTEKITITAWAAPISDSGSGSAAQEARTALEHALARCLAVRGFLVREGIALNRMTIHALASPDQGTPEKARLMIRQEKPTP
ncbi:hypothetical protein JCM17844_22810 [Iodidimonas gelatinilytica]|uniref:OmpA-like domain-containing protein n=1 Tax=Iodidimonas gelatinilytica TaxID=1236966 RepID=A0A5A7MSJ8_9PROT|nr:hypothetical protein [Iodidimonas gelatinilytica]GEQ98644.1 hypothetical protein JCM17844_22810 [Iodidimonas gelatinilytica]GER01844.1 hypothetical protein JCM17845_24670 [Iodidimonas gelatinilytica]